MPRYIIPQVPTDPREGNTGITQSINNTSDAKDGEDLEAWKDLMVNQINALNAKIRASTSREDSLTVDSDAKSILRQLEPSKTHPLGTHGRRELGISILESLANVVLFNIHFLHRNAEYLDIACYCMGQALTFIPPDSPDLASWLFNLAKCLQHRFEVTGVLKDTDDCIDHLTTALKITPLGPLLLLELELLGGAHQHRWTRLFKSDDINRAMQCFSAALSLAAQGSVIIPTLHIKISELFFSLSQVDKNRQVEGLERAIESQTSAVSLILEGDARLARYLNKLGWSYNLKFKRLGKKEDITAALEAHTRSLQLTPQEDPAWLDRMSDLGEAYQIRFSYLGDLGDCDRAIQLHEQVVSLAPEGTSNLATYLESLGVSYMERFSYSADKRDLDKAIEYQSRAVSLTSPDNPDLPGRLNNLGISYKSRFYSRGKLEDIDKSIELHGSAQRLLPEAVLRRPALSQPALASNLGDSFQARFSRLRRVPDIENAIECQTRAVESIPDDHPIKPGLLDSLGSSYQLRYQNKSMLHNLNDINKAIEHKTRAVQLAPEWHTSRAIFLNNLGLAYQIRFQNQNQQTDIDQASKYLIQAVALTPDGHSDKPNWLNNLGNAYRERFCIHRQLSDFNAAVEALSQAVSLTSEGHVNKPRILNNLAYLYNCRFEQSGNQEELDNAIAHLQKSIECSRGHPVQTFSTARFLARLLSSNNRPGSLPVYQIAIDCLPQIIWLGEIAPMRIAQTFHLSDLVQEAAAAAILDQEVHLALEWLEQGRSIVWGQFLQLRAPLDDLASVNPELAVELKQVADELYNTSIGIIPSETFEPGSFIRPLDWEVQRLHQAANHYDKLLDQVRQTPGFENFLRPKKASELVKAAQSGPIVVVNVHKSRCDSLILFPNKSDIAHIPLPNLYERPALKLHVPFDILSRSSEHFDEIDGFRGVRPKVVKDQYENMLGELWECVAKPILEALAISTEQPPQELTHITWNTTGPLSLLPLHAAGDYTKPLMRLFEFAISSYTPMLGVLLRVNPPPHMHARILAVGQEVTPGQAPLPGTKIELEYIKALAKEPNQYMQLDGRSATVSAVLDAMEEYDWVHLACHAYQLPNGPLGSSFRLHEGDLELMQIMQKHFRNKGLAFLSACHTAAGEETSFNESAHIASGMLIAGYPSVIATMWAIADKDAPLVASRVYSQVIKDGQLDYRRSARALHTAVGELRTKVGEKAFARWAPFIHIGS
ncbi:unnamed protein product [Rhizoctonia solani]|uniref:CHAT domain-containing protein n=1 Tax=Rhizoctonia solani TaxID=456999 RepID=A0A8H3GCD0_9AGAM|nr:unnamed protein product [Rhizoctonia solani]